MGITFSDSSQSASGEYSYHILRVQHNSPAHFGGLQPFFDFILAVNGHSIQSSAELHSELSRHLNRPVQLSVYSSKRRQIRRLDIVPRNDWGGQGLLGVSARLCSCGSERQPLTTWRVLDVAPGSPADIAGLRGYTDYIVGAAGDAPAALHSAEDLCELIESRHRRPLRLCVYSSRDDACREVCVTPEPRWGGQGALGCGIGYGYLHQIPEDGEDDAAARVDEPISGVPPNLPSAPESAAATTTTARSSVTVA